MLSRQGAEVAIAGRDRGRTAALAEAVGVLATAWPPEGEWDLLVNATPVGTWPDHEHAPIWHSNQIAHPELRPRPRLHEPLF